MRRAFLCCFFFFQAEDGIRDVAVTGVQTCALPICTIPVAGQTFSEANRLIMARLGSLLKRFEAHVSMARLRTIKVYVVGEVVRPGAYEVSSLASASNAIYAACGPAKSGSLRQIRIVPDGKVIAELDFYEFLLKGDRSKDVRLNSVATILIHPTGKLSAI